MLAYAIRLHVFVRFVGSLEFSLTKTAVRSVEISTDGRRIHFETPPVFRAEFHVNRPRSHHAKSY